MTTYTAVLPWVYEPYRDAFMESCRLDVFEVDNSVDNIGIMRATNRGIDRMRSDGSEWLVVMSAALRFGPAGGLDFVDHLARLPDDRVVEAAGVFGWHLIAFHRDTLDAIGKWDPNFSPYGYDDLDMSWRYQCVYGNDGQLWRKVPVDVTDAGMAHSLKQGGVVADDDRCRSHYLAKWGGFTGEERYRHPFADPSHPIGYWPDYEGERWDT